jgi:hypothetical protein
VLAGTLPVFAEIDESFDIDPADIEAIGGLLRAFAAPNFRRSEFSGVVLRGQVQKLETICKAVRTNARKVREAIADLPGLKLRKSPDLEGDLGVGVFLDLGTPQRRARFLRAMAAENVPASPPGGSVILPIDGRIERKATVHPGWPSFNTPKAGPFPTAAGAARAPSTSSAVLPAW